MSEQAESKLQEFQNQLVMYIKQVGKLLEFSDEDVVALLNA